MIVNSTVIFYDGSCRQIPITLQVNDLIQNEKRAKEICKNLVTSACKENALVVKVNSIIG
jgi:hypothetical protein